MHASKISRKHGAIFAYEDNLYLLKISLFHLAPLCIIGIDDVGGGV